VFGHLPELLLIGLLALIVFGPQKLPEVAATAGKMMRDLREAMDTAMHPEDQRVPDDFSTYYYESMARTGEVPPSEAQTPPFEGLPGVVGAEAMGAEAPSLHELIPEEPDHEVGGQPEVSGDAGLTDKHRPETASVVANTGPEPLTPAPVKPPDAPGPGSAEKTTAQPPEPPAA
jgi:TatA/E family protein of Tat protein translocase